MHPLGHHTGEQTLAPLLLLAGGGITPAAAFGRAWLADARERLTRKQGTPGTAPRRDRWLSSR